MTIEKSDIRIYETDEDAAGKIDTFRGDWDFYNILAYEAIHKTGLKLFVKEEEVLDENGRVVSVGYYTASENYAEWSRHMTHDEKMSPSNVHLYRQQLSKEFKALIAENERKADAIQAILPHAMAKAAQNKC